MTERAIGCLIAVLIAGALAYADHARSAETGESSVLVTRPPLSARPAGCDVRDVGKLLVEFFAAFNAGDEARLDRLFAPGGEGLLDFKWFSVTEAEGTPQAGRVLRHVVIRDRAQLLAYFAERHRVGERRTLRSVSVNQHIRGGDAGFTYTLRRTAEDLAEGLGGWHRVALGKGGIDCRTRRIFVWSEGMTMADRGAALPADLSLSFCPEPSEWSGQPPLACWGGANAPARASGFHVATPRPLPGRCAVGAVSRRVLAMISSFNIGGATVAPTYTRSFSAGFARDGVFVPHREIPVRGRSRITQDVRQRYRDGEGLTVTRLSAPHRAAAAKAVFRLRLAVGYQGRAMSEGSAVVTIDCRSGLVVRWVGPNVRIPPHAGRVSSFGPAGAAGCAPASPASAIGPIEARGTAAGSGLWALFFGGVWASTTSAIFDGLVGTTLKIVVRASYPRGAVVAIAPDGTTHAPAWGPTPHAGSSWTRPGGEFGVGFAITRPGCWRLHVAEDGGSGGDVWFYART